MRASGFDGEEVLYASLQEIKTIDEALKIAKIVYDDVQLRMKILGTNKSCAVESKRAQELRDFPMRSILNRV